MLTIKPIKSKVEIGIKGKISEREREKSSGVTLLTSKGNSNVVF